jgi:TrmH family RNA methyltransferase
MRPTLTWRSSMSLPWKRSRKSGMITSAQNPRLKLVRTLQGRPKDRREAGAFLAEGVRLLEEAADRGWPFRFVLHTPELNSRARALLERLKARGVECEELEARLLQSLSETETSQGLLAVLELTPLPIPAGANFLLIPDQVRDPGNLGTLLRSAAAAGVQAALLPPETTDAFSPKAVRAGMGAHFRLPIHALGWERIGELTAGLTVYLAEMDGVIPCWQADFRLPLALIVGGEAEGASPSARRLAAEQVRIPMPGGSESLNAAVAGSVLLFEILRQRSAS